MAHWIVWTIGRPGLLHQLSRPGLVGRTILERLADVSKLRWNGDLGCAIHVRLAIKAADAYCIAHRARQAPDSREIRFAIGSPGRGRGAVGLTVRQPGNPRSR